MPTEWMEPIEPMRAVAGDLPTDNSGWRYEIKWDGMRLLAHTDGATSVVRSSNSIDATTRFPELADIAGAVGHRPAVLDGEVVCTGDDGLPSFGRLQRRMHVSSPEAAARASVESPVTYVLFDLLYFDGTDAMPLPWEQRRSLLTQLVEPGPSWVVADAHSDGAALLSAVRSQGLEGIVAKQVSGAYQPGRRSPTWRKVKVRNHQELVVGGWSAGEGHRSGGIGSLLLGYYDDDAVFRHAGRVGTGWSDDELARLRRVLEPLVTDTDPFEPGLTGPRSRGVTFVRPEVVVEVAHGGWTEQGQVRHGSYIAQRLDKAAGSVGRTP